MKKSLILILLLLCGALQINAIETTNEDRAIIDSIFRELNKIDDSTDKVTYLHTRVQNNKGKAWVLELLDSALIISKQENLNKQELRTLFEYCRYYQFIRDEASYNKRSDILKDRSYELKYYNFYLSAWVGKMQYSTLAGQTEYVIIEAKKMREEMKRLGNDASNLAVELVLGHALSTNGKNEEAISLYKEIIEQGQGNFNAKIKVHIRLSNLYREKKEYNEAIKELNICDSILTPIHNQTPIENRARYNNTWFNIYTSTARIYAETKDKDNLLKTLLKAEAYYSEGTFYSLNIGYNIHWGAYYQITKEWDKCFEKFDCALRLFDGKDLIFKNSVLSKKANAYEEAGRYRDAAKIYEEIVQNKGRLNQKIAEENKELHKANYQIQAALAANEKNKLYERTIEITISILFIIILIILSIRSLRNHLKLQRLESETREALALTESADQVKENFLRNITYEVRIPLNTVVGFSDILSTETNLTTESIAEYSQLIRQNTEKLLLLINNVLDLSRLEAGMMAFQWDEYDALQLCREVKMMVEMQNNRTIKMNFLSNDENAFIRTDSRWFIKVLTNLLVDTTPRTTCKAECEVELKNKKLIISIYDSHEHRKNNDEQNRRILHSINQLFIKACNGDITRTEKDGHTRIIITLPLS